MVLKRVDGRLRGGRRCGGGIGRRDGSHNASRVTDAVLGRAALWERADAFAATLEGNIGWLPVWGWRLLTEELQTRNPFSASSSLTPPNVSVVLKPLPEESAQALQLLPIPY